MGNQINRLEKPLSLRNKGVRHGLTLRRVVQSVPLRMALAPFLFRRHKGFSTLRLTCDNKGAGASSEAVLQEPRQCRVAIRDESSPASSTH